LNWKNKEYWLPLLLILGTAFYTYLIRYQRLEAGPAVDLTALPAVVGDWESQDHFLDDNVLNELKSNQTLFRRYVDSRGNEIWLFVAYWASQKYGAQPHSPLHCLPGSGWNIIENRQIAFPSRVRLDIHIESTNANMAQIANKKQIQNMIYWYQTRSGSLVSELEVKLDLARNALLHRPTDAAFIRLISAQRDPGQLMLFGEKLQPFLAAVLPF